MKKLRTQVCAGFAVIVLVMIALVSLLSNVCISRQFVKYVEERQKEFAEELANGLASQYNRDTGEWNLDYIHGFGMVALSDGYIIKVYDAQETMLWDAQNHDMTLCHQVMEDISLRMEQSRPNVKGEFVSHRYELKQEETLIGYAEIYYYTPYYLNETDFHFLKALNLIFIIVGILSLGGAAAAGFFLANRISMPISSAIEMTKEISEGNYTIRFEQEVRTEELHELKEAVNQMAESLCQQEDLRKRLTTDVAHELRTPLTNVSTYVEAMMEGVFDPSQERLRLIYEELTRITRIVTELEQLRQVENETLNREPVHLLELAEVVRSSFEQELKEKQLSCIVEGEAVTVIGDKSKLHQAVYNLMSNAVKYSLEGGEIRLFVRKTAAGAELGVADEGIGIPEKELPLIFERFYRTDRSRNRKTGGVGIGLTIVKSIVQAHGGRVEVESREGEGSCFRILLPVRINPEG